MAELFLIVSKIIFLLLSDSAYRFLGNHTHTDYFKLLRSDGQSLLIGARNVIYNISLPSLQENVEQVNKIFIKNPRRACTSHPT